MDKANCKCIWTSKVKGNWHEIESATDLIANILSRVPVKHLLIFKTVSKFWNQLISSASFKKLQLTWSRENPAYLLYPDNGTTTTAYLLDELGRKTGKITLPGFEDLFNLSMVCSCNGLVCFTNYPWFPGSKIKTLEIRMCNLATHEVLLIPKGSPSNDKLVIGVAFGPEIGEYKIIQFYHLEPASLVICSEGKDEIRYKSNSIQVRTECEVYSSATGTWRRIDSVTHCPMGSEHVCIDGTVYWFVASEEDECAPGSVLSFDMEENFNTIDLPNDTNEHSFLIDYEGCLSFVVFYDEEEIMNVWVLKDCNESIWELKCSGKIPYANTVCTESVAAIKEEIFVTTSEHSYIYNPQKRKKWRKLEGKHEENFPVVFKYTESLLPCKSKTSCLILYY